ncbi:hypothetical protein HDV05_008016 [Chytridiales sp. JEL 0842]|nr:hypothetical protein HDV05_008016 [Chytridiales sp. JEL 0842]
MLAVELVLASPFLPGSVGLTGVSDEEKHNHQKNQAKLIPNLRKVVQKTIKRADQLQHHVSVSAAAGTFMEFFEAYQQAVADNCNIRREALGKQPLPAVKGFSEEQTVLFKKLADKHRDTKRLIAGKGTGKRQNTQAAIAKTIAAKKQLFEDLNKSLEDAGKPKLDWKEVENEVDLKISRCTAGAMQFWRLMEDLFFHSVDLARMGHFWDKQRQDWGKVLELSKSFVAGDGLRFLFGN